MNTVFMFPGQGSQFVGMCKDLYDKSLIVRDMFNEADDILNFKLSHIILSGSESDLALTANTQPAIFLCSAAIIRLIEHMYGLSLKDMCNFAVGHSLGEYSALFASQSISFAESIKLTRTRGVAMQNSCPQGVGAMAACIGISVNDLQTIIDKQAFAICQIANDNTESQQVISGEVGVVESVMAEVGKLGKRAIKLKVSAAFHSDLMNAAVPIMQEALNKATIEMPIVKVISNSTVTAYSSIQEIRINLPEQLCKGVRWRETINHLYDLGVTKFVEVGPGSVLTNMLKKDSRNLELININSLDSLLHYAYKNNFTVINPI